MAAKKLVDNPKGLPIVDATDDLNIEVTESDVRKAVPLSPTKCALANAACRMEGVARAHFNKAISYLVFKDRILRFETPESATREMVAIDRGGAFAVGKYTLKRVRKSNRLDRDNTGRKGGGYNGKPKTAPATRHVTVLVRGA